jgi:hypothetical protein
MPRAFVIGDNMKRCPECDYPNPDNLDICFKCAASLDVPEQPELEKNADAQVDPPICPSVADDPVATDGQATPKPARPVLPGPLKVAVNALLVGAVLLTLIAVLMLVGLSVSYTTPQYLSTPNSEEILRGTAGAIAGFFLAAIAAVIVCYGLTNLKPWARIAGLILYGVFIASALWLMGLMNASGHFGELTKGFLVMSIFIVTGVLGLWGLFSAKTKEAFKRVKSTTN